MLALEHSYIGKVVWKVGREGGLPDQKNGIDSMCAINNGSERVLQSTAVQLRPQASGNRAIGSIE